MKKRITNLLTATLWLLIVAVWIPSFWVLLKLPGTWDGSDASALAEFTEDGLQTVYYNINRLHKNSCIEDNWLLCEAQKEEGPVLETSIGDWFIPLIVFTLLVLGGQYLLTGKVTLRFTKEQEADDP